MKIRSLSFVILVVTLALLIAYDSYSRTPDQPEPVIKEIAFEGLIRTNEKLVAFHIRNAPDKPYSATTNSDDIRRLMGTGFFKNVTIKRDELPDGIKLTYKFDEKPIIKSIVIRGNKRIKTKKIRKLITLQQGDIFDVFALKKNIEEIKQLYSDRGYKEVQCSYKSEIDQETNVAVIEIDIREGARPKIIAINVTGNEAVKKKKILKVMKNKKRNFLSIISKRGIFDPDALDIDREMIENIYFSQGYLDAEVTGPEAVFSPDKEHLTLNIRITEGTQYLVGRFKFNGNTVFDGEKLAKTTALRTGGVFRKGFQRSLNTLDIAKFRIASLYATKGYIEADIDARIMPGEKPHQLDIVFEIEEREEIRIRKIDIVGNTVTKDKVIRRELGIAPGQVYDSNRVNVSISRLMNLGYFKKADIYGRRTPVANQRDVVVAAEEGEPVRIGAGMAFSSVDRLVGSFDIGFSNFDLMNFPTFRGGGQKLHLRTQFGSERSDYDLNFTEPWLFDRRLSAGFDIYSHDRRYLSADYDQKTSGFALRLGKRLLKRIRGNIKYKNETIDIDVHEFAPQFILDEAGRETISSIELAFIRDTRNHLLLPTRGMRSIAIFEFGGGILGADRDFHRQELRQSVYIPVIDDHTLALMGRLAFITPFGDTDEIPIYERYFLGGQSTIRGFEYRKVGPKDESGEPIGGQSLLFLSAEYTIPLIENIHWAFFYDTGNVYSDKYSIDVGDLRVGVGVGIRFIIPALRLPVSFDYAWPIDRDQFDSQSPRFEFSLGTRAY